jgi:hypothetical protein
MQWLKSAMVVSSVLMVAAAFSTQGCSGGGTNKDAGADVIIKDGQKTDTKPPGDGATTCGSGLACEQCDVTGFTPTAQGAPFNHANKCPAADIAAYIAACGSNATSTSCSTWQNAENTSNKTCLSCIYSPDTGSNWGPLVCPSSGFCSYNFPGCIDLKLNQVGQENATSDGSCGDLFNAGYGCQDYACNACLIGADGGFDNTSFTTCDNSATGQGSGASNECGSYISKINTAPACAAFQTDAATPADSCFPSDSQAGFSDTEFSAFVTLFCGQ